MRERWPWLFSAAAAIAAGVLVVRSPDWTVDDAYIVARYARNLAEHGVFAWNVDGPRVEGITGVLLALVEAAVTALGGSGIVAARWLGAAAFVASSALVVALAHAIRPRWWFVAAAAIVFLATGEHAPHVRSGLETELYVAFNLACAVSFVRDTRARCSTLLLLSCNAVALTRPEGVLVAGCVLVATLVLARTAEGGIVVPARRALLGFALPMLAVTGLRWLYFGSLLPNTFYAKRGAANAEFLRDLWAMTSDTSLDLALLGVVAALVAALRGLRVPFTTREKSLLGVGLVVIVASALAYGRSDLVMNYGRRFALHVFPWVLVALLVLASPLVDLLHARAAGPLRVVFAAGGAVALGNVLLLSPGSRRDASALALARAEATAPMYDAAETWIREHTTATATLACYPDAGKIPFATGLRAIDFGKLNDTYLARSAETAGDVADYFFRSRPDVLLLWKRAGGAAYDEGAGAILDDERFAAYRVGFAREQADGSGLFVYVLADAPLSPDRRAK